MTEPVFTFSEKRGRVKLVNDAVIGGVTVPSGFETDLDSVPQLWVLSKFLKHQARKSAIVHDYHYAGNHTGLTRKEADALFYRLMLEEDGVSKTKAKLIWLGVRIFGKRSFKK